jgi:hypothetical protein
MSCGASSWPRMSLDPDFNSTYANVKDLVETVDELEGI